MKILTSREGGQILANDNGTPKSCPFQPTQLIPGNVQGSLSEIHKPCGNWCPFFFVEETADEIKVTLNCVSHPRTIISTETPAETQATSTILKSIK